VERDYEDLVSSCFRYGDPDPWLLHMLREVEDLHDNVRNGRDLDGPVGVLRGMLEKVFAYGHSNRDRELTL
jgi:hypothetical protein